MSNSTDKTTSTGTTTRITIAACVLSSLAFACFSAPSCRAGTVAIAPEQPKQWAIAHRAEAYDELLPRPQRFQLALGDSALSLRSAGFDDRFEFSVTVIARTDGSVEGEVLIPSAEPLVVQLTRLRAKGCQSLAQCIDGVHIERRKLEPAVGHSIVSAIETLCVPFGSQQKGLHNDQRDYDLAAMGWSELLLNISDDPHATGPLKEAIDVIKRCMKLAGLEEGRLAFRAKNAGADR